MTLTRSLLATPGMYRACNHSLYYPRDHSPAPESPHHPRVVLGHRLPRTTTCSSPPACPPAAPAPLQNRHLPSVRPAWFLRCPSASPAASRPSGGPSLRPASLLRAPPALPSVRLLALRRLALRPQLQTHDVRPPVPRTPVGEPVGYLSTEDSSRSGSSSRSVTGLAVWYKGTARAAQVGAEDRALPWRVAHEPTQMSIVAPPSCKCRTGSAACTEKLHFGP